MELTYIKLYLDFLEEAALLTTEEIGRLVTAMLHHARGEDVPEGLLSGNERFLFPRWQLQVDRDRAAYAQKCETNRQNALRGGRPRKPIPAPVPAAPQSLPLQEHRAPTSPKSLPLQGHRAPTTSKSLPLQGKVAAPKVGLVTERRTIEKVGQGIKRRTIVQSQPGRDSQWTDEYDVCCRTEGTLKWRPWLLRGS